MAARWLGIAALGLPLGLAGCGNKETPKPNTGAGNNPTAIGAAFNASPAPGIPARGGLPQDVKTTSVKIANGKLDPDTVTAQVNVPFILVVQGDGQPHTLVIQNVVDGHPINAQGATQVQFTVPNNPGRVPITLDGKDAGTFEIQSPSGGLGNGSGG